ncbi:MAG TPA: threonine synthase [Candidatus Nanopelagicales bacterium]
MSTTHVAPSTTPTDPDAAPARPSASESTLASARDRSGASPDFGPANRLVCRECGAGYDLGAAYACIECFGPLEVGYDFTGVTRELIESGPQNMWRYSCLLPVAAYAGDERNLNPGLTKLVRADNLAAALGMTGTLWIKDDSGNPTHSFKDRVVAVAQSAARRLGLGTIACASTGNLANAVAAAAARAGMDSVVVIPSNLEDGKVLTTAAYGGILLAVDGNYDDVNRLCSELVGDPLTADWGFVNVNLRPYYAEGSKTVGYEIAEQLGWRLPAQVVAPIASGSLLTKVDKAFREFTALGLVEDSAYRVYGAQATGCSPVSAAFRAGHDVVRPVKPDTIAKSLAIGNPADGPYALDVVRRTGGAIEDVSDAEVVEGIRLLAETEGIFAETAGGVVIATLRKLLASGQLDGSLETVALNTGDGLKTLDAIAEHVGPTATIAHDVDEVTRVLAEHHAALALQATPAAPTTPAAPQA